MPEIIRTVTLNTADFIELQGNLRKLGPSCMDNPELVQHAKSEFLRSKGESSAECPADLVADPGYEHTATMDIPASSGVDHVMDVGDLSRSKIDVPNLSDATSSSSAVNTTGIGDLIDPSRPKGNSSALSPLTELTDDSKAPDDSESPDDSKAPDDSNPDDAELPDAVTAVVDDVLAVAPMFFPCKIRYIDLTVLGLKEEPRVPMMMLIRSEWDVMMQIIQRRRKGVEGSIVLTGQTGIGEHIAPHLLSLPE